MNIIEQYQEFTPSTFLVSKEATLPYLYAGLPAEAGEVAGNYAKFVRGDFGEEELKTRTIKELGDVMYFVSQLCNYWDMTIEELVTINRLKLEGRRDRGTLQGDGDNR